MWAPSGRIVAGLMSQGYLWLAKLEWLSAPLLWVVALEVTPWYESAGELAQLKRPLLERAATEVLEEE